MPQSLSSSVLISFCFALSAVGAAGADTVSFASQVEGIEATALVDLPAGQANPNDPANEFCVMSSGDFTTKAGQAVAAKNWLVTAEVEREDLTFISFVERSQAGTSASCLLSDGNVGIFRGRELLGVIYSNEAVNRSIGFIQKLEDDRLRIWDGDYLAMPLADLQIVDRDLVIVRSVADNDSFCSGQVSVPNIFGLKIQDARRVLFAEGWVVNPLLSDQSHEWYSDLVASLPELDVCSGTGLGFCAFGYIKNGSNALGVTTAGEDYRVAGFSATCE